MISSESYSSQGSKIKETTKSSKNSSPNANLYHNSNSIPDKINPEKSKYSYQQQKYAKVEAKKRRRIRKISGSSNEPDEPDNEYTVVSQKSTITHKQTHKNKNNTTGQPLQLKIKKQPGQKRKSSDTEPNPTTVSDPDHIRRKDRRRHASHADANKLSGIEKVVQNESHKGVDFLIEDDDASYYSVTCICKEPFAGRLMVECDICKTWYHVECVSLTKDTLPKVFICTHEPECRDKKRSSSSVLNNNYLLHNQTKSYQVQENCETKRLDVNNIPR